MTMKHRDISTWKIASARKPCLGKEMRSGSPGVKSPQVSCSGKICRSANCAAIASCLRDVPRLGSRDTFHWTPSRRRRKTRRNRVAPSIGVFVWLAINFMPPAVLVALLCYPAKQERPNPAIQVGCQCCTAASLNRSFMLVAAFLRGEVPQCGRSTNSLQMRQCRFSNICQTGLLADIYLSQSNLRHDRPEPISKSQ